MFPMFVEDLKHTVWHRKEIKKDSNLNIRYGTIHIKQYSTVTYLGCALDGNLSGKPKDLQVIKIVNTRLRFLYGKNRFLL